MHANLFDDTAEEKQIPNPAQALEIHTYRYGDEILTEGAECPYFFVILSGQVRISQRGKRIRVLEDQDVFGLENVLFEKSSGYSARALTKSRIAAYGAEALDHVIRESPRMVRRVLISTLQQLTQTTQQLLDDAETFALDDVSVSFFGDGDVILQEGTKGGNFYRLVSTQGGLRVTTRGQEVSRIERPGEFFGEMAGLLSLPRQATITSIGESVVETYNIDDLGMIVRDYPDVAVQLMRALVSRLLEVNCKLSGANL